MLIDDQSETIAALSSPEAYGLKSSRKIILKETNISDVFLTGEKAYKLKRGVKYPYVDYSSVEKRQAACQKELEICDRFAPGLCFGVEDLLRAGILKIHTGHPPVFTGESLSFWVASSNARFFLMVHSKHAHFYVKTKIQIHSNMFID